MNYQLLLEQVSEYSRYYYQSHDTENLVYHNRQHTEDVVKRTTQIANHYQLNDRDFFIVCAAAWFHDLGYMSSIEQHEENSAEVAEGFLKDHGVDDEDILLVKNCIMATKVPQEPTSLLEEVICDADLYHLGTDEFFDKDKLLLKEINLLHNLDISKADWRVKSVRFLESHHYHTDYCQLLLDDAKQKNLEFLKNKIDKAVSKKKGDKKEDKKEDKKGNKEVSIAEVKVAEAKKAKKDRPDKGIETMFRVSSSNHQRLSDMADNKAHIMITVNSIILSAIISLLLRRLSEYHYLMIPTCILLSISLLAMTFAILSTRPSIPPGTFSRLQVDDQQVNLLFFGNFYKMPLDDYKYGMEKMMEDRVFLYGSLIRDVYAQGVVLGRKYRLLRVSYNVFMFGLIAAVVAFIIAVAFADK